MGDSTARPRKGYSLETELKQSFSYKKCKSLFQNYSSVEDPNKINPDGMIQFCKDIDIDPENTVAQVGMLVLAWHMKAKQMGYFSLEEWSHGLEELQCDSIFKIKSKFEELQESLSNPTVFKNVYRYAFDFCRDKDQRSLDIEMAIPMLRLLLQSRWELFPYFQRFDRAGVEQESNHRVINKDQWYNILEFCRTIKPDLQNYDEDGACEYSFSVIGGEFLQLLKKLLFTRK
ncbi:DCUN1D5 [Cordylochernes scorpioides]|uniref:Defective in cullin neddylation protein n=1 Tax=Cordylochernes scorpioides TaxID=51811 RepID=A0ABY6KA48_9ARAC|nr:DCUN1D5 [Cordylochernes scorpioides]